MRLEVRVANGGNAKYDRICEALSRFVRIVEFAPHPRNCHVDLCEKSARVPALVHKPRFMVAQLGRERVKDLVDADMEVPDRSEAAK